MHRKHNLLQGYEKIIPESKAPNKVVISISFVVRLLLVIFQVQSYETHVLRSNL